MTSSGPSQRTIGKAQSSAVLTDVRIDCGHRSIAPEDWHLVGAAGEPPFLNDWANGGSGFAPLRFYKDQLGIVHIQGTIATPGITNHVFTLPPGYRPAFGLRFRTDSCCPAAVYGGSFFVLADGTVTKQQGSYDNVSLDGIAFRAEQ